ncbi:hypothetical protein AM609_11075 [Actinomyces sp. oral taxon 414]|uniref:hypothetical protein n=1 Tax=Actinomyces sp. oral taxon 414 TaxID=712122 RepID=UPI0006AE87B5|nr:hypothetical protein [Actinomyces sp. oral taxon 414]ALC99868.1 hypothetical protein AM609_11075 [Actinomyces sp. oral taxon 414]
MRTSFWARLARSAGRGRRDPRAALRQVGFADEEQSTRWLHEVVDARADRSLGKLERIRAVRAARPDLTLSTAVYIVDQVEAREARDVREPREG